MLKIPTTRFVFLLLIILYCSTPAPLLCTYTAHLQCRILLILSTVRYSEFTTLFEYIYTAALLAFRSHATHPEAKTTQVIYTSPSEERVRLSSTATAWRRSTADGWFISSTPPWLWSALTPYATVTLSPFHLWFFARFFAPDHFLLLLLKE